MVDFPFKTAYWPDAGTKQVDAVLDGRKLTVSQCAWLLLWFVGARV